MTAPAPCIDKTPLTVATFVWPGPRGCTLEHAAILGAMVQRHAARPVRFVVVTDTPGKCPGAEVIRTPPAAMQWAGLPSPEGDRFPSSYRRLWLFSEEARSLGPRVMLIDVDAVVCGDLTALSDAYPAPFVGWRPRMVWGRPGEARLAGGQWVLSTGARRHVWERFFGASSMRAARAAGFRGSDQAWISFQLAKTAEVWPDGAGVYSIRDFLERDRRTGRPARGAVADVQKLPDNARVVHLNGPRHFKPWSPDAQKRFPWIREHWRR